MPKFNELIFDFDFVLVGQVYGEPGSWLFAFYAQGAKPVMHNFAGLIEGSLALIIDTSINNTPYGGLEVVQLHINSSPSPSFMGPVWDRLREPHEPVQDVQFQPGYSILRALNRLELDVGKELPGLVTSRPFLVEGSIVINITLHTKASGVSAGRVVQGAIKSVDVALRLLLLIDFRELPVDQVPLDIMLGGFEHECSIVMMSMVEETGHSDNPFAMHLDSNVSSLVRLIIPILVTGSVQVLINLGLRNMAFDLCNPNGLRPLSSSSLFKVLPQVAIRSSFPVNIVALVVLEIA